MGKALDSIKPEQKAQTSIGHQQYDALITAMRFLEGISAKIHGLFDESDIYETMLSEFSKSKQYSCSVLLLTDDKTHLRFKGTSLASGKLKAAEKASGLKKNTFLIDLANSPTYTRVVKEKKIVQTITVNLIGEVLPKGLKKLATLLAKAMGLHKKVTVLLPLNINGSIIGVIGLTPPALTEHFIPSAENFARHISSALELAHLNTKRMRVEEELLENEEKYRSLFEYANDAVIILDISEEHGARCFDCNESTLKLFGCTHRDQMIGKSPDNFSPPFQPDGQASFEKAGNLARLAIEGHPQYSDWEHVRPDGTLFWVEVSLNRIQIKGNYYLQAVLRDITKRKKADEALRNVQKLESLGVLAGGISHDFNNLLSGLFGFLDLARESIHHDTAAKENIESALQCFSRAKDLTQQLLTFSKGGAPQKEAITLDLLLKESIKLSLSGSNIRCEKNLPPELHFIEADHGQMNQALNNILLNARQAMPNGGTIQIEAHNREIGPKEIVDISGGAYVNIKIEDLGTGIPQELLPKVFDPFFTTKQTGSGLGLATTYSIIKKHGGHISIESELGKGTTINIILPAIINELEKETTKSETNLRGTGRILFMDDEEVIRKLAQKMISRIGYEIVCVENGKKAIEAYTDFAKEGKAFDAVILDLTVIGGKGGEKTIRQLLEIDPNVKAIVSSGYSNSPALANPREYGFVGRIAKPYLVKELAKVLNDVLKKEGK